MTKIDIISGFLGAGKTTLIKKLIEEAFQKENIVLIENEFGEIGIDGGFLEDAGINIREMNSGCICCSLVGDFSEALKKVIEEYSPDRIIIEPSGVGKLSDVVNAVKKVGEETSISLNCLTTVTDAQKCKMYLKNFSEFYKNQLFYANTIILSRTQNLSEEKLDSVVKDIRSVNENANLITTSWDAIDGVEILQVMEQGNTLEEALVKETKRSLENEEHHHEHDCGCEHHHEEHHHEEHHHEHDCGCGHHHEEHHHEHDCGCEHHHEEHHHEHDCGCGHHHADEVFTSWGMETPRKYTKEEITHILKELSNQETYGFVLRAKGMLDGKEGTWHYFDFVPEEYEIREGKPTYTGRFCVIGSNLKETALKNLFQVA